MAADPWTVVDTQPAPPISTQPQPSAAQANLQATDPWTVVSSMPMSAGATPAPNTVLADAVASDSTLPFSKPALGIGEAALNLGTQTAGQIFGGLAGLGTLASNGLGITHADPSNVINRVENALTYQPQTSQGQNIVNALGSAYGHTLGAAANWGGDIGNRAFGPLAGTAIYTGINAMPMALGLKGDVPTEPLKAPAALVVRSPAVANAINLGYKLKPSEAGGGALMRGAEGLAGSSRLEALLNEKNQGITNSLSAQELGLPPGTTITPQVLEDLRKAPNAVYQQVASLGKIPTDAQFYSDLAGLGRTPGNSFPLANNPAIDALRQSYNVPSFDSADALLHIRNLRKNGYANIRAGNANMIQNAPMVGELGNAQVGMANAIENQIGRGLSDAGADPDLIANFGNARTQLAKINNVDQALIGDTGNVSAQSLAKQANKGAPLSGNLRAIAQTANDFPHVTRDVEKVRNFQPFGSIHGMGGGGMLGGMGIMELLHNPSLGIPWIAASASTPLVRAGLASDWLQQGLANPDRFKITPQNAGMMRQIGAAALMPEMANQNALMP